MDQINVVPQKHVICVIYGTLATEMVKVSEDGRRSSPWRRIPVLSVVDTNDKIESFIPAIDEAVKEGLATLEKVEIRFYRSGKSQPKKT